MRSILDDVKSLEANEDIHVLICDDRMIRCARDVAHVQHHDHDHHHLDQNIIIIIHHSAMFISHSINI